MSTISLCDVCETLCKTSIMGTVQLKTAPDQEWRDLNICPGCVGDIVSTLGNQDRTRPEAYKEPYREEPKSDPTAGLSTEELAAAYLARVAQKDAKELGQ